MGDRELFPGAVYPSPRLPIGYLEALPAALRARPGYEVPVDEPGEG